VGASPEKKAQIAPFGLQVIANAVTVSNGEDGTIECSETAFQLRRGRKKAYINVACALHAAQLILNVSDCAHDPICDDLSKALKLGNKKRRGTSYCSPPPQISVNVSKLETSFLKQRALSWQLQ
jgi:hypothetical protein